MNVEEAKAISSENFEDEDEDFDMINMMLMIKDTYQVSGNAYHEFTRVSKQMPRHFRLEHQIVELNSLWTISPTLDGSGVQQSLEDRLRDRLTCLVRRSDDAQFKEYFQVTTPTLVNANFTFTILDEGKKAFSVEGNYCVAIFQVEGSYEGMKLMFASRKATFNRSRQTEI